MNLKFTICLAVATLLLSQNSAQAQSRLRLEAQLTPTNFARQVEPLASAKAKYELRGNRAKFSCEAEDFLFVQTIAVFRGRTLLGFADVDATGVADLNLDTLLGDRVPRMRPGHQILVRDFDTGRNLFTGRLRAR